jgi:hypothetical protein
MADDAASTQAAPDAVVQLKSPYQRRQDVFDAPDFDPVKFINQIYPDGGLGAPHARHGGTVAACRLATRHTRGTRERAPVHVPTPCPAHVAAARSALLTCAQRRRWGTWTGSQRCCASRWVGAPAARRGTGWCLHGRCARMLRLQAIAC